MAIVAAPGLPLPAILLLLLATALFAALRRRPLGDAARDLPRRPGATRGSWATHRDGPACSRSSAYFGASLAAVEPRLCPVLINAATFGCSARCLVWRDPAPAWPRRSPPLRPVEGDLGRVSAGIPDPGLASHRATGLLRLAVAVVPEGLAAAWAALSTSESSRGWSSGIIMAAVPLGSILGAVSMSRLVPPATRRRLLRPLGDRDPAGPGADHHRSTDSCGRDSRRRLRFAIGGLVPIANGQFVQAPPNKYRAGLSVWCRAVYSSSRAPRSLSWARLADVLPLPVVVGLWSLAGVFAMVLLSITWPAHNTPSPSGRREAEAANAGLGSDVLAMDATTASHASSPPLCMRIARRQPPTPPPACTVAGERLATNAAQIPAHRGPDPSGGRDHLLRRGRRRSERSGGVGGAVLPGSSRRSTAPSAPSGRGSGAGRGPATDVPGAVLGRPRETIHSVQIPGCGCDTRRFASGTAERDAWLRHMHAAVAGLDLN